jgi:hypothetical protein
MSDLSAIFDDIIEEDYKVKLPIAVLKEIGQALEKKTQGLLIAQIRQEIWKQKFQIHFAVIAPSLNNYGYHVFWIEHDINIYPLKIYHNEVKDKEINNQEELEKEVKSIFSSSEVKRVINGLLAQIKAA